MQNEKEIKYITRVKIVGLNFFNVQERSDNIIKNWETAGKFVSSRMEFTKCNTVGDINEMFNLQPRNYVLKHCNFINNINVFNSKEDMEEFIKSNNNQKQ